MEPDEVWAGLTSAVQRLGRAGRALARAGMSARWGTAATPLRCLVLAYVAGSRGFGVAPGTLARRLGVPPTTLAYHLDRLEGAGLVRRSYRGLRDLRKVTVRITPCGADALAWAAGVLSDALGPRAAALSPDAPPPPSGR